MIRYPAGNLWWQGPCPAESTGVSAFSDRAIASKEDVIDLGCNSAIDARLGGQPFNPFVHYRPASARLAAPHIRPSQS